MSVNTETSSLVHVAGDGNPDGLLVGRTSGKLGFYGLTTPIVKPTVTITTTASTTVVTTVATDLAALKAGLVALGLIK
jgi:hypothetical protein